MHRPRHHRAQLQYEVPQLEAWRYFHPAWTESQSLFVGTTQEARPGDKIDQYLRVLAGDPKHRLDPELRPPGFILDRVLFWVSVYARYPSHVHVVHDRDTPNVIYGYIDFAPLKRESLSGVQRELKARAIERQVLVMLRQLISEALGTSSSRMLADEERRRLREIMSPLGPDLTRNAGRVLAALRTGTGQRYLPGCLEALQVPAPRSRRDRQSDLPVGLARIPFVESSFNARAHSRAGASAAGSSRQLRQERCSREGTENPGVTRKFKRPRPLRLLVIIGGIFRIGERLSPRTTPGSARSDDSCGIRTQLL